MISRETKNVTLSSVKKILELPDYFEIINDHDFEEMLEAWKRLIVIARREGSLDREIELNRAKQWIIEKKSNFKTECPRCHNIKSSGAELCQVCNRATINKTAYAIPESKPVNNSIAMNFNDIITQLNQQKEFHEKKIEESTNQIAMSKQELIKIHKAIKSISSIEGISFVTSNSNNYSGTKRTSVTDMIEQCARAFVKDNQQDGVAVVFSYQNIYEKASTLFPQDSFIIKRGIYTSIHRLITLNKIKRVPNGFEFIQ